MNSKTEKIDLQLPKGVKRLLENHVLSYVITKISGIPFGKYDMYFHSILDGKTAMNIFYSYSYIDERHTIKYFYVLENVKSKLAVIKWLVILSNHLNQKKS
jgi:hypothetical protein